MSHYHKLYCHIKYGRYRRNQYIVITFQFILFQFLNPTDKNKEGMTTKPVHKTKVDLG